MDPTKGILNASQLYNSKASVPKQLSLNFPDFSNLFYSFDQIKSKIAVIKVHLSIQSIHSSFKMVNSIFRISDYLKYA